MKVQEMKTAEFQPVHVQITFETKEEMRVLLIHLEQTNIAPKLANFLHNKLTGL